MAIAENKSEHIKIRTTPNIKALLQQAASASHKNVTEFLLEAGVDAAEDALADRRMFRLDERRWRAFQEILDRPVPDKPRLGVCAVETVSGCSSAAISRISAQNRASVSVGSEPEVSTRFSTARCRECSAFPGPDCTRSAQKG